MKRNALLLILLACLVFLCSTAPCFALGGFGMPGMGTGIGTTGLGAGIMFPDIDGVENDSTMYYLFDYKSYCYSFEVNYFDDDDLNGWMLHGDYLYPLSEGLGSEAYLGFGYSYIFGSSGGLDDENGFNIALGLSVMDNIDVRGRYLFLGSGDSIITAGASYYF